MPGAIRQLGPFTVEALHAAHSIPDACAVVITCNGRRVVHTGDFKIDPQAVSVTHENSRANRAAVDAFPPEALPPGRYDVIVANILAQPLIDLAPVLSAHAGQGTRLALAGVLESQAADVAKAYAGRFEMAVAELDEGWALLTGAGR